MCGNKETWQIRVQVDVMVLADLETRVPTRHSHRYSWIIFNSLLILLVSFVWTVDSISVDESALILVVII